MIHLLISLFVQGWPKYSSLSSSIPICFQLNFREVLNYLYARDTRTIMALYVAAMYITAEVHITASMLKLYLYVLFDAQHGKVAYNIFTFVFLSSVVR